MAVSIYMCSMKRPHTIFRMCLVWHGMFDRYISNPKTWAKIANIICQHVNVEQYYMCNAPQQQLRENFLLCSVEHCSISHFSSSAPPESFFCMAASVESLFQFVVVVDSLASVPFSPQKHLRSLDFWLFRFDIPCSIQCFWVFTSAKTMIWEKKG